MTSDLYYDTPCTLCGQGILRTGKRGRPPKQHKGGCPTVQVKPTVQPRADDTETPDDNSPEAKAVEEFLNEVPARRVILPEYDGERISKLARKLDKGDMLWVKRDGRYYEVKSANVVGEHCEARLKEYVGGRVPNDLMRIIADGLVFVLDK